MALEKITQCLENLIKLHKSLNELARQKTERIVKGDLEALQTIVKDETKHIGVIQRVNTDMIRCSKDFLHERDSNSADVPTLSEVIAAASHDEQETLTKLKEALEEQIQLLKNQNQANQELLEQSLQFVHLSLDLLNPEMDAFNYGPETEAKNEQKNSRSIFDSKA